MRLVVTVTWITLPMVPLHPPVSQERGKEHRQEQRQAPTISSPRKKEDFRG
jgi:hypothetical protein